MPLTITAVEASSAAARARVFNRMGNSRYRLRIDRGVPGVDATRYELGCARLLAQGHVLVNVRFSVQKRVAWSAIRITPPLLAAPVHSAGAAGTLRRCPILGRTDMLAASFSLFDPLR